MKLKEYNSLEEKGVVGSIKGGRITEEMRLDGRHHISLKINTIDDVDKMFEALKQLLDNPLQKKEKQILFRGVSESKYKTYTSSQRYWLTNELYKQSNSNNTQESYNQFIQYLIDKTKTDRDELLLKLYNNFKGEITDLLFLSFIQHYEGPSPLLDVTYNPYKALFFCFDKNTYYPSDKEIENYCSLYCMNCIWVSGLNELPTLPILIRDGQKDGHSIAEICAYLELAKNPAVIIRKDFVDGSTATVCLENHNLIAQDGAFLLYSNNECPLDEMYDEKDSKLGYILTFEIHKSLKDYIMKLLADMNITHDTLYPDLKQMAKSAYLQYMRGER